MKEDIEEGKGVIQSMESPTGAASASASASNVLVVHSSSKKRKVNDCSTTTPVAENQIMGGNGITFPKIIQSGE